MLGLSQWVRESTFVDSNNLFDFVFTTKSDRVGEVWVLERFSKCHHCPVVFEYILHFDIPSNVCNTNVRILWSKGDCRRISDSILAVDWEFDSRSLQTCFS